VKQLLQEAAAEKEAFRNRWHLALQENASFSQTQKWGMQC